LIGQLVDMAPSNSPICFDPNRIGKPTITGKKIANGTSGGMLLPGRNTPLIAAL
jgi:hypothetical protein